DYLFDAVAEGINIRTMEGRASFSKRAAPLLDRLPKGVFRELMFENLATRTGLSRSILQDLVSAPAPVEPAAAIVQSSSSAPARPSREQSTASSSQRAPQHCAPQSAAQLQSSGQAHSPMQSDAASPALVDTDYLPQDYLSQDHPPQDYLPQDTPPSDYDEYYSEPYTRQASSRQV